jgi:alpha-tubulin suppressor-like RCC1 family protein
LKSFICTPVTWVSCGFEHCLALTIFGTVASWGYGASGCLGHGNYISYTSPKLLTQGGIQNHFITYIECGGYHNAAIS